MKNLLVTGSIAFDRIAVFKDYFGNHIFPDKVHQLNVSFNVEEMTMNHGGTGGTIAYNLTLLGETPILLGAVGYDGEEYLDDLIIKGVNCDWVRIAPDELTANAMIMTDLADNQISSFYVGAMRYARECSLSNIDVLIDLAIIAPNDPKTMVICAKKFKQKKIPYIADPGQSIPVLSSDNLKEMISGSDILMANDYEWQMIRTKTGFSLEDVLEHTKTVIVTYADKGSSIWQKGKRKIDIPVYKPKKLVDPTGCGDAYRAGLMHGLSCDYSLKKSAHIGSWLASKCIEHQGTQNHTINEKEFEKLLKMI